MTEDEILAAIDRWHEVAGKTLPQYLGMTHDEYAAWVERRDAAKIKQSALCRLKSVNADLRAIEERLRKELAELEPKDTK